MRAIVQFLRVAWSEASVDWRPLLLSLLGAALGLLSQLYMGRFVDAGDHLSLGPNVFRYASFLIIGLAVLELQSSLVGSIGMRLREAQKSGALELYLSTPIGMPTLLIGLSAYDIGWAIARLITYFVVGGLLFGVPLASANWLVVIVALKLAFVAFVGLALIGAAITLELRRGDPLSMVLGALSIIAGEVLYPASVLPAWLSQLGQLLPLRTALEVLRSGLAGEPAHALPLAWLVAQATALFLVGVATFWLAFARARRSGALTSP